jgi:hypothetical protein
MQRCAVDMENGLADIGSRSQLKQVGDAIDSEECCNVKLATTRGKWLGFYNLSIILLKVKSKCPVVLSCLFLMIRNSHINKRKSEKKSISSILHRVLDSLDLISLN